MKDFILVDLLFFAGLQAVTYGPAEKQTERKPFVNFVIPISGEQMALMEVNIPLLNLHQPSDYYGQMKMTGYFWYVLGVSLDCR